MAERLAFNLWGAGRTLRGSVGWVKAPESGSLPDAAATYLPPIEKPNWGFWGVFAFTALLFFRPQDTVTALRAAALARARRHRRARRHGHTPARQAVAARPRLARNDRRRLHGLRDAGDGSLLGLARRRPRYVYRRLLQSRARLPSDGQLRAERESAASADVADPHRRRIRSGARRARLCERHEPHQRRAAARLDLGHDGQPERPRHEHGHLHAAGGGHRHHEGTDTPPSGRGCHRGPDDGHDYLHEVTRGTARPRRGPGDPRHRSTTAAPGPERGGDRRAADGGALHAVLVLGPDCEYHRPRGRTNPDRGRRAKT